MGWPGAGPTRVAPTPQMDAHGSDWPLVKAGVVADGWWWLWPVLRPSHPKLSSLVRGFQPLFVIGAHHTSLSTISSTTPHASRRSFRFPQPSSALRLQFYETLNHARGCILPRTPAPFALTASLSLTTEAQIRTTATTTTTTITCPVPFLARRIASTTSSTQTRSDSKSTSSPLHPRPVPTTRVLPDCCPISTSIAIARLRSADSLAISNPEFIWRLCWRRMLP
ncbi:hypothetical protein K504DRAFT_501578 [Pleomassaria siparia CBS 279.74]|uniref:Uncharacterized protein n=1 Tax=Pleomassaria siparia CBS 279.74 TaxID=1314801 RepID=A0A6G1KCF0_9PLEO|nr:hypothetical protein K504DRAFT_501578 [Pleomassaria siparia CBS 279.74]